MILLFMRALSVTKSSHLEFSYIVSMQDLAGTYAAREFVWWYNGHPDCRNLAPDLKSTDTAVILGQVSFNGVTHGLKLRG